MKIPFKKAIATFFFTVILSGCSILQSKVPSDVLETNSLSHPVRALTGFSQGLVCTGRLLKKNNVETIYVMAADIPDYSETHGAAGFGAKEMIISSISRLSEENGIVRFVAYDRRTPNIVALHNSHPKKKNLRIPDFYIRGAITQIDSSPFSKQKGTGLNLGDGIWSPMLGFGASHSNSVTLKSVTLDLNMGLISNYQLLPGVTSSNTLSVLKIGDSTDFTISFSKIGGIFSMNENRSGALSNALRALVEVGIIELKNKLYNVTYENCLADLDANSLYSQKVHAMYDSMSKKERFDFIVTEMNRQEQFNNSGEKKPIPTEETADIQNQIAAFRVANGLFPNTSIDYRLFERCYKQSQQPVTHLTSGSGVGPLDIWLHAEKKATDL
ncbi:MAG: hypothetical protein ABGY11_08825 [Candidatus Thioglobus sp.]